MGTLFIFIFITVLVISALLFFNKGEKAQEIKSILKQIYENFKELFNNLKNLFLKVKEIIQTKSDKEPKQLKDELTQSQLEVTAEPEVTAEVEVSNEEEASAELEASPEPEIILTNELETPPKNSINGENNDIKGNNF